MLAGYLSLMWHGEYLAFILQNAQQGLNNFSLSVSPVNSKELIQTKNNYLHVALLNRPRKDSGTW